MATGERPRLNGGDVVVVVKIANVHPGLEIVGVERERDITVVWDF